MKIPTLRKHATGQWFCKWGGKHHYFGTDYLIAIREHGKSIEEWQQRTEGGRSVAKDTQLVRHLVTLFCDMKEIDVGIQCSRHHRKHLRRFGETYGSRRVDSITGRDVEALVLQMVRSGFAARTINHDLVSIKALYRWGAYHQYTHSMDLSMIKPRALPPAKHKRWSPEDISRAVNDSPERLRPFLAINYLGLMRPSEVIKVVMGEYTVIEEGVFRLDDGKTDRKSAIGRHIIMSPLALEWLSRCHKKWTRLVSYETNVRNAGCLVRPKEFQKAGASHLVHIHHSALADVELLLGHVRERLTVTYYTPPWGRLRELASLLAL